MERKNLVDANKQRALLLSGFIANRLDAYGVNSAWAGYNIGEGLEGVLIASDLMCYHRPGYRDAKLYLRYPKITDEVDLQLGEPEHYDKNVIETYSDTITKIKGVEFDDSISHTFSKLKTMQEAFKVGAEVAIKAGFEYSGVSGEVSAKITSEYSRQWGEQTTHTDTVSRAIKLPVDFEGKVEYTATRSVDKIRRQVKAVGNMTYEVEVIGGEHYQVAKWSSLSEFLLVATGFGDAQKSLYREFINNRLSDNEVDAINDAGKQSTEFVIEYENVNSQEIDIK